MTSSFDPSRRALLSSVAAAPLLCAGSACLSAEPGGQHAVTDFGQSFMHCAPKGLDIWVRVDIECRCEILDAKGAVDQEFLLGVKAQTGLTRTKEGTTAPGYEYWMIFAKTQVYMKRVRVSAYSNDSTVVPMAAFGSADSRIVKRRAIQLTSAKDVADAIHDWRRLVARTEFASTDGARTVRLEYPVKWADCSLARTKFRVETGPVLLLEPDQAAIGTVPAFDAFRWAHLDYHGFDQVRCLVERPSSLLGDLAWPQIRQSNPSLTPEQVAAIEQRLITGWTPPPELTADRLRGLFTTDRYTEVADHPAKTALFALA